MTTSKIEVIDLMDDNSVTLIFLLSNFNLFSQEYNMSTLVDLTNTSEDDVLYVREVTPSKPLPIIDLIVSNNFYSLIVILNGRHRV